MRGHAGLILDLVGPLRRKPRGDQVVEERAQPFHARLFIDGFQAGAYINDAAFAHTPAHDGWPQVGAVAAIDGLREDLATIGAETKYLRVLRNLLEIGRALGRVRGRKS